MDKKHKKGEKEKGGKRLSTLLFKKRLGFGLSESEKQEIQNLKYGPKTERQSDDGINVIKEIAQPFWVNSISDKPPKFAIITGAPGSGKTTVRRKSYSNYVNFDFWEISSAVKKVAGENNPNLTRYVVLTCALILGISIESKRNIVIEIIGDREDFIKPVIDGMLKIGYKISIIAVAAKPLQSFERHIKAVMNDKDYMSAAYTQRDTLFYFYQKLDLGKMPPPDKNEEKIKNN